MLLFSTDIYYLLCYSLLLLPSLCELPSASCATCAIMLSDEYNYPV